MSHLSPYNDAGAIISADFASKIGAGRGLSAGFWYGKFDAKDSEAHPALEEIWEVAYNNGFLAGLVLGFFADLTE